MRKRTFDVNKFRLAVSRRFYRLEIEAFFAFAPIAACNRATYLAIFWKARATVKD